MLGIIAKEAANFLKIAALDGFESTFLAGRKTFSNSLSSNSGNLNRNSFFSHSLLGAAAHSNNFIRNGEAFSNALEGNNKFTLAGPGAK